MEERQRRVAERRRNWDRQGETAHRSRDTGRKGEMSPKLQRVFVSLRMVGDSSRKSRGGNLSSSFKWPIDHSSRPFLQSNVDVQISQECEGRGGPATRDSGQLDYDLQLRQSTGQGSGQNSGVQCQSRRRKGWDQVSGSGESEPGDRRWHGGQKICRGETFPCGTTHLPPSSLVSSTQMCALGLKLLRVSLRHYRFNDYLY